MTPRGLLIVLGVFAAFLAIFVPLARRVAGGTDERIDAERLRRTFAALALYEASHEGLPAPDLRPVLPDLDPSDLQSTADPLVPNPGPFPLDPTLPNLGLSSTNRVSWSYRWHWRGAGDPRAVETDPRRGLLADPWTDPILRVNTNGALLRSGRKEPPTFVGLFGP